MKILSFLIVTVFIALSKCYHINYQAHGFNDMNYFIQLLQKGVDIFKFDVNLSTKESCLQQTTWKEKDNECEYIPKYGLPTCCLVFRGDQSTAPIWEYPLNTTNEFIDIFNSGKYDYILSKENALPRYSQKKMIALNMQYGPYAVNDLTTDFLYRFFKAINDRNLNVEIIFGRNEFITDFDLLCLGECTPQQKYISDFPVILQSDEDELPILPKKRRFNFNTNYYNIENFCENGFPTWITEDNEFPMIFWEPSHEDGMKWTFYKYFNYTCDKPSFKSEKQDYQQANNQEPEMQQVYLRGVNETISGEKFLFEQRSSPVLEYLDSQDALLMGYYQKDSQDSVLQTVNEDLEIISTVNLQSEPLYIKKQDISSFGGIYSYVAIVIQKEVIQYIQIAPTNEISQTIFNFELNSETFLTGSILAYQNDVFLLILNKIQDNDEQIQIEVYEQVSNSFDLLSTQNYPINTIGIKTSDDIINADFEVLNGQFILAFNLKNQKSNMYAIIGSYNSDFKNSKNILNFDSVNIQASEEIKNFDYGVRPVVRLYENTDQNSVFFLIVSTHGISQSGVHFNNNNFNKCLYQDFPGFEQLLNLQYAMNYIYGELDSLQEKIQNQEIVNGCSNNIHHAHFNNGDMPSIVLKQSNIEDSNYFTALVLHEYTDYLFLPGTTKMYSGANGQYIPGTDVTCPRPWEGDAKIPVIVDSIMFETFSLVPFEVFPYFSDSQN